MIDCPPCQGIGGQDLSCGERIELDLFAGTGGLLLGAYQVGITFSTASVTGFVASTGAEEMFKEGEDTHFVGCLVIKDFPRLVSQ